MVEPKYVEAGLQKQFNDYYVLRTQSNNLREIVDDKTEEVNQVTKEMAAAKTRNDLAEVAKLQEKRKTLQSEEELAKDQKQEFDIQNHTTYLERTTFTVLRKFWTKVLKLDINLNADNPSESESEDDKGSGRGGGHAGSGGHAESGGHAGSIGEGRTGSGVRGHGGGHAGGSDRGEGIGGGHVGSGGGVGGGGHAGSIGEGRAGSSGEGSGGGEGRAGSSGSSLRQKAKAKRIPPPPPAPGDMEIDRTEANDGGFATGGEGGTGDNQNTAPADFLVINQDAAARRADPGKDEDFDNLLNAINKDANLVFQAANYEQRNRGTFSKKQYIIDQLKSFRYTAHQFYDGYAGLIDLKRHNAAMFQTYENKHAGLPKAIRDDFPKVIWDDHKMLAAWLTKKGIIVRYTPAPSIRN